jgi:hypothetical protein
LAFENYDAIGRYRATYPGNIPIDAASTLPPEAGGAMINNGLDLVNVVSQNGVFTRCMTTNLMQYGLAEAQSTLTPNDCAVKQVHDRFQAADQSFTSLIRSIALSETLSLRAVGAP